MIVMERRDTEMETEIFGKNDQMDPNKSLRTSPHDLNRPKALILFYFCTCVNIVTTDLFLGRGQTVLNLH